MKRGQVWRARLGGPAGIRPVLLLTRTEGIAVREFVTIAPISRTMRGIPVEVPLSSKDGLAYPCAANLDSIQTIPKIWLKHFICELSDEKIAAVNIAVRTALELGLD